MNLKKLGCFLLILSLGKFSQAQILINEMMSNNQSFIADGEGDYSDWIELYNYGSTVINLQGYALSDNIDSLLKWQFPSKLMNPGSHLLVWCSGKNKKISGAYHTNFSIDSQGEAIYLSDSLGNVIDYYQPIFLPPDNTYGNLPNGSSTLTYLSQPTPGSTNNPALPIAGVITDKPQFNIPGGLFRDSLYLSLSHPDPFVAIHYTLDGTEPTTSSPVFTNPLLIKKRDADTNYYSMIRTCYQVHPWLPDWHPPAGNVFKVTVVRARVFKSGYLPGPIQTYTYFINDSIFERYGNLPLVSVVSDPKNLFNDTTGIYVPGIHYQPSTFNANYYLDWDRPANIEMYLPDGRQAFNSNYKINVNGQSSPSSPQKGLNIVASTDYGDSKINYPLFENTSGPAKYITHFDKIKIRAWGSDRNKALFRDAYTTQFMLRSNLDYEAYRPCVVFINGEYWGLQELRERDRNGSYLESHYLINEKNPGFDIVDASDSSVIEGDSVQWQMISDFLRSNSLADSANYAYAKSQIDVNSMMMHYLFSIYCSRADWPYQNEGLWRPKIQNGKWKWIMWDMDNVVAFYVNPWYDMFQQAITGNRGYGPSAVLNYFLANPEFKKDWVNLFADYMNTEFLPPIMQAKVDEMKAELNPYMPEFRQRWQANNNWQNQLDSMKWWVNLRPQYCRSQILSHFNSPAHRFLVLNVSDTLKGKIKVNTITLDENTIRTTAHTFPWSGKYFENISVPVTAIAKPGYKFIRWQETNDSSATIQVNLTSDTILTALFDIDSSYHTMVNPFINEVMSSNNTTIADNNGEYDDWIEIYNPNDDTLDIGGYYLTDNLVLPTRFHIAAGTDSTKIPPHGFLLIWADDDPEQGMFHTNFKFSSSGDFLALFSSDGTTLLDSIRFGTFLPDIAYGRNYDGSPVWINFPIATPQATNVKVVAENLVVNEVMTDNASRIADEHVEFNSWVEIYNPNTDTVDLAGWFMTDNASAPAKFRFAFNNDSTKIPPLGYKLIWADEQKDQGVLHLNFVLGNGGNCVMLYKPDDAAVADYTCFGGMQTNISRGRRYDGSPDWIDFFSSTPNASNQTIPFEDILINEVLTTNNTSVTDEHGEHESWIELFNPNMDTVDIAGWFFTNEFNNSQKHRFTFGTDSTKISPHGFKLLWADNQVQQGVLHLNFHLNSSPTYCLALFKSDHIDLSDSMCFNDPSPDQSYGRIYDGAPDWISFPHPTPDTSNSFWTGIHVNSDQFPLQLFPNPTHSGKIFFNKTIDFWVSDMMGRNLIYINSQRDIDISDFSKGVYFLTTAQGEHLKFVIE